MTTYLSSNRDFVHDLFTLDPFQAQQPLILRDSGWHLALISAHEYTHTCTCFDDINAWDHEPCPIHEPAPLADRDGN